MVSIPAWGRGCCRRRRLAEGELQVYSVECRLRLVCHYRSSPDRMAPTNQMVARSLGMRYHQVEGAGDSPSLYTSMNVGAHPLRQWRPSLLLTHAAVHDGVGIHGRIRGKSLSDPRGGAIVVHGFIIDGYRQVRAGGQSLAGCCRIYDIFWMPVQLLWPHHGASESDSNCVAGRIVISHIHRPRLGEVIQR